MPERRSERNGPDQRQFQPQELRYYWDHPVGSAAFHSKIRRDPRPPSPALFEHASPLPSRLVASLATGEQATQPALPFSWYSGDHPTDENTEITSSQQVLKQVEERGIQTLSNSELLSLVLSTSAGSESVVKHIHALLRSYSIADLLQVEFGEFSEKYGLRRAKAAQLQALLELSQRLTRPPATERYQITSPRDAATLLMPEMAYLDHEEMRVLVLDTKNSVVVNKLLYQGTVNSSVLRAAEIFRLAVTRNCPGVIIAHNHPSGDPTPSPEDISCTEQLVQASKVLDVELIDHLVIGKNDRFVSLRERLVW